MHLNDELLDFEKLLRKKFYVFLIFLVVDISKSPKPLSNNDKTKSHFKRRGENLEETDI
jgi:hypothetical protein